MTTWPELLGALVRREDLDADTTAWAMGEVMGGEASPVHVAAFVVAMRSKGETVTEVEGLVRAMMERARLIDVPGPTLDIVGSGGDQAHTVNISTMASIVAASTGVRVVKHGNRAASSACGTADVLEELGVALDLTPDHVAAVAIEAGITFCFAPVYHPALRHAIPVRRELAIPTIFNFLGPLANPARPTAQAVGVADRRIAPIAAGVLARRGISALVFRGDDGLDELTTTTTSSYWEVRDGSVTEGTLDPASLGVARSEPGALRGGDKVHNAGVVRDLLAGKTGAIRDAVLLNAGAALAMCDPTDTAPLTERVERGIARAAAAVDDGSAGRLLDDWIAATTARRPG